MRGMSTARSRSKTSLTRSRKATLAKAEDDLSGPYPKLMPRDEAVFLLHTAAEIEHSLMVQYLYAAMTLDVSGQKAPDDQKLVAGWQRTILGIAMEEMGHFITIQSLLRLLGGPLNFEREDTPFRSDYYPFRFSLRPLTNRPPTPADDWKHAGTLNRYIAAEMPAPDAIESKDLADVLEALGKRRRADLVTREGEEINRVGRLYARLTEIFESELTDKNFLGRDEIEGYMPDPRFWDRAGEQFDVMVLSTRDRAEACGALRRIAEQGEGELPGGPKSHFQKFLGIYRDWKERGLDFEPWLPVPNEPTTSPPPKKKPAERVEWTYITHPAARCWAQLFDLRYRLILDLIQHHLLLDETRGSVAVMRRAALANAAMSEMHTLRWLAGALIRRPLTLPETRKRAAPAFELPYTFAFPDRDKDRAEMHRAVLEASKMLGAHIREIDVSVSTSERQLLESLDTRDLLLRRVLDSITTATEEERAAEDDSEESEEDDENGSQEGET